MAKIPNEMLGYRNVVVMKRTTLKASGTANGHVINKERGLISATARTSMAVDKKIRLQETTARALSAAVERRQKKNKP